MAFGQQTGPPATAKQLQLLLALLQDAGHSDFRDARGPMNFTQRQAGGKFTRDEATAFIEQLEGSDTDIAPPVAQRAPRRPANEAVAAFPVPQRALSRFSTEQLADELRHRGWTVTPS